MKGPEFLSYVIPVHEALKNNGGAGSSSEIIEQVLEALDISDKDLNETTSNGQSRIRNQIQWSRFYLFKAGLIDNSERGIWRLTDEGMSKELNENVVLNIFKQVQDGAKAAKKKKVTKTKTTDFEETTTEDEEHATELIEIIKNTTPEGFERLCKRLLTEIGIHDIRITGGAGDQGIDGVGTVKLNDVVSLNIVFQCKRYKEIVVPHHIRDFRGAMQGRGEKGLVLTTGRFTKEAKVEANRDGVPPIELIDGDRLVSLFEKHRLGLKPVTTFEIDMDFFKNFY